MLFDAHGHGVHLGERDCSAQRRHQKIVEETPVARRSTTRRARGCAGARWPRRRPSATSAPGTFEFLVAADGAQYFLEVNARLQVEHRGHRDGDRARPGRAPAPGRGGRAAADLHRRTSSVAGTRSRRGSTPRTPTADSCRRVGHLAAWKAAALARACASITRLRAGHDGARRTTIRCSRRSWRAVAIARRRGGRLLRAIERTRALGLITNKAFLLRLLGERRVRRPGRSRPTSSSVGCAGRRGADRRRRARVPALAALLLSGAAERVPPTSARARCCCPGRSPSTTGRRRSRCGRRRGSTASGGRAAHRLLVDGAPVEIALASIGDGTWSTSRTACVARPCYVRDGDSIWIETQGAIASYRPRAGRARGAAPRDDGELRAPMAAQVVAVAVAAGDRVEQGAAWSRCAR